MIFADSNHGASYNHQNKALGRTIAGVITGAAANLKMKLTNFSGSVGDLNFPLSAGDGGENQPASSIPLTVPGASANHQDDPPLVRPASLGHHQNLSQAGKFSTYGNMINANYI